MAILSNSARGVPGYESISNGHRAYQSSSEMTVTILSMKVRLSNIKYCGINRLERSLCDNEKGGDRAPIMPMLIRIYDPYPPN